jgi:hypothetical protein
MAKNKPTTTESIDLMRRDLKEELKKMNTFLKAASNEESRAVLLAEIAEMTKKLANMEKKQEEVVKEEIKKSEPLHKTIKMMADDIGRNTAISRTAQQTLTDMFHGNRELVDIYKKDSSMGQELVNVAIRDMAKAMSTSQRLPIELVEKQIRATIEVSEAMKDSQQVMYSMNKSLKNMAHSIQHNLKKWPVLGRFFSDAMMEHYKTIAGDIQDIFKEHMSDILKPIEILIGPFKALFKIGGILFKLLQNPKPTMAETRTARWQNIIDRRMLRIDDTLAKGFSINQRQLDLAEDAEKASKRHSIGDKKGPMFWIASILGLVSGAIVGLLGGVQVQALGFLNKHVLKLGQRFEGLFKGLDKVISIIMRPIIWLKGKILKEIEGFMGLVGAIGKRFKSIGKIAEVVKGLFGQFGGGFVKGFLRGLKWIAWPITLLMTVIDAVKGFVRGFESQGGGSGGIISGLVQGLGEAVKGFLYLPVKLFGWITDYVLGLFDIQIKGGAADGIFKVIDMIFGGIEFTMHTIYNGIVGLMAEMIAPFSDTLADEVRGMKTGTGLNADPTKQKAIANRTASANAPAQAKANAEAKTQQQQKDVMNMQSSHTSNSFDKTINEMGNKISSSIQVINKTATMIPTAPEETYLALMGNAIGGA